MATILVVDDHVINREFLATLLGYVGHTVLQAADGAEGLAVARSCYPDLVISDVLMPTMGGVEFANRLHAEPAIARIPLFFYTATYRMTEARALARSCGVSTVLPKPAEPQAILDAVAAVLGDARVSVPQEQTLPAELSRKQTLHSEIAQLQQRLQRGPESTASAQRPGGEPLPTALASVQALGLRLAALLELGLVLVAEPEPKRLLDLFCRAAQDIMNSRYAAVGILDSSGQRLEQWSCRGLTKDAVDAFASLDPRAGVFGEVLAAGNPRQVTGLRQNPVVTGLSESHPPVDSLLIVPLNLGSMGRGWLYFADRLGAPVFSDEDQQLATLLGTKLGLVYGNVIQRDEIQQHAARLEIEIVERQRATEELQESELRFRQLAENIREVFFLVSADSFQMLYVSPAYEEIWGRSCASLYADPRSWMESVHPGDRETVRQGNEIRDKTGNLDYEYRILLPDGTIRWIHARGFPIRNETGEIYRIAGVAEDVTERVRLARVLQEREAGLHRAQVMAKTGHVITGVDGSFESWSETLTQIIGLDSAHMPPSTRAWLEIVHPDDRAMFRGRAIEAGKKGMRMNLEYRFRRADGVWIDLRQVMEPIESRVDTQGRTRWFNTIQDVTEQKEQQKKIVRLNRIYAVLSGINSAIVRIRDRNELFQEACRIAVAEGAFKMAWIGTVDPVTLDGKVVAWHGSEPGYVEKIRFTGRPGTPDSDRPACVSVREKRVVICNDVSTEPSLAPLRETLLARGHNSVATFPLIVGDRAAAALALFAGETGFFDEQELKLLNELAGDIAFGLQYIEKEEKLSYLAYYDALTGLPNSRLFSDRLTQFLRGAKHDEGSIAVMLIDLDRFTQLNDTLGRHVGDQLLQQVANRFAGVLRDPYILARISADTYAVALADLHTGADAASITQRKLFESLNQPFLVDGKEIRITARAGFALYPNDGRNDATLFKNAEAALKQAQSSGERYLYYAPEINAQVAEKLALENKLRAAVEHEQFVLHYQPKIDSGNGRVVGLEALIRWRDPETGLVPPGRFIPVLETSGLIVDVGQWALTQALSDYVRWREAGLHPPRIAVNVSSVQLRRQKFADIVRETLERSGAGAAALELEITESLIMEDIDANTRTLNAIQDMGVAIAMDDFGTGFSSLSYLAKLPVDSLKIDRSFVITMVSDPDSMAIVSTVISLAHALDMIVVAEGVDAEEQAELLRRMQCDEMQGYLFSKPVPPEEIGALLRKGRVLFPGLVESSAKAHALLVVDDDPDVLSLLEHDLRSDEYQLLTTTRVSEAFDLLARHKVEVVLCDQRMPGMSGTEFLSKVRKMYPDAVRVLTSAYEDFEAARQAINLGAVHKFVRKSLDRSELKAVLNEALQMFQKVR